MAPAVHENDRPRALHGCEWHEALNAHAMNPVLRLIHANLALLMSRCRPSDLELGFLPKCFVTDTDSGWP